MSGPTCWPGSPSNSVTSSAVKPCRRYLQLISQAAVPGPGQSEDSAVSVGSAFGGSIFTFCSAPTERKAVGSIEAVSVGEIGLWLQPVATTVLKSNTLVRRASDRSTLVMRFTRLENASMSDKPSLHLEVIQKRYIRLIFESTMGDNGIIGKNFHFIAQQRHQTVPSKAGNPKTAIQCFT